MSSNYDENCVEALKRIYPKIDMAKICNLIENTPMLSDQRIEFYTKMLQYRKELILDRSMELLVIRELQKEAGDLTKKLLDTGLFVGFRTETQTNDTELVFKLKNNIHSEIRINTQTKEVQATLDEKKVSLIECVLNYPELLNAIRKSETIIKKSKDLRTEEDKSLKVLQNHSPNIRR